jgi:hippurate hydrolase
VFQPAEEGGGGAREMIRDGIFQRFAVDAIFGAHNWPGLPAGQFALTPGPCFASSNTFTIAIEGRGGHAAMPHLNVDPIPAACQLVQALQTVVSRNVRPIDGSVLSVTMVHAGEADNVTPERCTLGGTVRAFSGQVLDVIEQRMRTIAESTAAAFGCRCRFEFVRGYPPTVNHERETGFVRQVLGEVAGPGHVHDFEPTMGAEDFSYFLEATPGCYFLIGAGDGSHREAGHGAGPAQLHNPSYDFNDALIPVGGTAWARLAESWLAPR